MPLFLWWKNIGFSKLEKFKVPLSALGKNVTFIPSDLTGNPLNNIFLNHSTYKYEAICNDAKSIIWTTGHKPHFKYDEAISLQFHSSSN